MSLLSTKISQNLDGTSGCPVSLHGSSSSSSSNNSNNSNNYTTFHPFLRLPWELRTLIWELTIAPRTVPIHVRSRKKWFSSRYNHWPKHAKLLFTAAPFPRVLHACQEARNHLTQSATRGHYEKMSASHLFSNQWPFAWELDDEGWPVPAPYIWVSFDVDMIDIGLQRFKLNIPPKNYAAKFKRIRFKPNFEPSFNSDWVFEVLMLGMFGFPNIIYAEIDVSWLAKKLPRWARRVKVPVNKLVCGPEKVVCFGGDGEIMTLKTGYVELLRIFR